MGKADDEEGAKCRKRDTTTLGYIVLLQQEQREEKEAKKEVFRYANLLSHLQPHSSHHPQCHLYLSLLTFFNISTANDACSSTATMSTQTTCFMSSCSFSSVYDAYDGGIVPSLNNPLASLSASNTSFIGCCRTRNVVCKGTTEAPLKPDRQNETFNGANSFILCEWSGSRTTGESDSYTDGISSGGAICMYSQSSAAVSVSHCAFNECVAHWCGGGISCYSINSVDIENNTFNACTAQTWIGGEMCIYVISSCVRISGCEFQTFKARSGGGRLYLDNFNVSGIGCIPTENGEGESACMFDCGFTSCSVTNSYGGGISLYNVPVQFKMRSIQFISCSAASHGGGLRLHPNRPTASKDRVYCYFLFFHGCKCSANPLLGHDMVYLDYYNIILNSDNPFYECYTTNTDEKRVCYGHDYSSSTGWTFQHTEKKDWLKRGILNRFVAVSGGNAEEFCGANESYACRTIGVAVEKSVIQVSLSVTLMEGNHTSETETIDIGEKKISVIGKDKEKCSIGTGTLSTAEALFSVTTGHLGMSHLRVDCNSRAETSPSVVVVSDGSGLLSLEDVVIAANISSGNEM
ncbi:uncharacterized protein MONOS_951 [Monocercomonoides exilis]|uniref:uncharacterized protein n=1 Tax=Monocercomonoides exilis TaxID=2049356 RepID=UPI003559F9E5|nr:hypothetical protein MONOS_951 [Monocercomonoides exilis]|eukprot:MONOS_951.1-p1 / transcript=MONOS_951.1 / gene=MONOS_951 / organism=Monocercomonoides_exilis_PA203 / gene_product=unspecified product / transcript_product=unspecified product / location=Mono_scaffold00015:250728-252458(-) / protein_length=577 / sequence_SO=supercontig / SO=protein_coding / is_pseudo=false